MSHLVEFTEALTRNTPPGIGAGVWVNPNQVRMVRASPHNPLQVTEIEFPRYTLRVIGELRDIVASLNVAMEKQP